MGWVDSVLRRHAAANGGDRWETLLQSEFGPHIPVVEWPRTQWTVGRVKRALASMREQSAPGPPDGLEVATGRLAGITRLPPAAGGDRGLMAIGVDAGLCDIDTEDD